MLTIGKIGANRVQQRVFSFSKVPIVYKLFPKFGKLWENSGAVSSVY